jgi:hypothetical protein
VEDELTLIDKGTQIRRRDVGRVKVECVPIGRRRKIAPLRGGVVAVREAIDADDSVARGE